MRRALQCIRITEQSRCCFFLLVRQTIFFLGILGWIRFRSFYGMCKYCGDNIYTIVSQLRDGVVVLIGNRPLVGATLSPAELVLVAVHFVGHFNISIVVVVHLFIIS